MGSSKSPPPPAFRCKRSRHMERRCLLSGPPKVPHCMTNHVQAARPPLRPPNTHRHNSFIRKSRDSAASLLLNDFFVEVNSQPYAPSLSFSPPLSLCLILPVSLSLSLFLSPCLSLPLSFSGSDVIILSFKTCSTDLYMMAHHCKNVLLWKPG